MKTSSYHPDTLPVSRDSEQENNYSIPVQKEKTGYCQGTGGQQDNPVAHGADGKRKE